VASRYSRLSNSRGEPPGSDATWTALIQRWRSAWGPGQIRKLSRPWRRRDAERRGEARVFRASGRNRITGKLSLWQRPARCLGWLLQLFPSVRYCQVAGETGAFFVGRGKRRAARMVCRLANAGLRMPRPGELGCAIRAVLENVSGGNGREVRHCGVQSQVEQKIVVRRIDCQACSKSWRGHVGGFNQSFPRPKEVA